ncbi:hypothetical protein HGP28_08715 [Vibrio sp. SM6]|uniref:Uncharacterized protein n=1 Tax=Vibrio agarilyticus TaxID=2726741 RepID=A0A7X8YH13_9VIBR|nr:DUF6515 family protein [Vibrio agarilyticus]NLS12971.1 hypothetical protein [Vibrio agarilyticus]
MSLLFRRHTRRLRACLVGVLALSLVAPTFAGPIVVHKPHKRPNKVIVVKPNKKPAYKRPIVIVPKRHRAYHKHHLPKAAAFIAIAGITYAVINNAYYQRQGDQYIHVEKPMVANSGALKSSIAATSPGVVTKHLPHNASEVTVDGTVFFVHNGQWYAPIAGSTDYVTVAAQL